jgi:iron only hydrogenase large subunit-like protein
MNSLKPIYTEITECQDCYKCLRECDVKAIDIRNGHASVIDDLCVLCGKCVQVCPMGAKRVRNDIERVKLLLKMKSKVLVSLAPSYLTEFCKNEQGQLIKTLKNLGFFGVSETALGAEQISAAVAKEMENNERLMISSACPSVVELIKRYYPEHAANVCNLFSPVLAHCKSLRQEYGEDIGIVFVGPCIAKKREADDNPDLLDIAITFQELRGWIEDENIELTGSDTEAEDDFIPTQARQGSLYPIDGGMIAGIEAGCGLTNMRFMTFSGSKAIQDALSGLDKLKDKGPLFLEMLACEGGCVNGPLVARQGATVLKRCEIIDSVNSKPGNSDVDENMNLHHNWDIKAVEVKKHSDSQLNEVLKRVGKFGPEDELNCGGCGYDSCKAFAYALLDGRAEEKMCVGYMRQVARKQADALLRAMPSGVVIVDEKLKIVESNMHFAELMGSEVERIYSVIPRLEGAYLEKIAPFYDLFEQVMTKGIASVEKDIKFGSTILHVTVFTIEKYRLVGGILQDITVPEIRKEQIVNKAKKVIERNLETVQKIAYLLGENAADSEVILNSIVESFSPETAGENDDN